jgi:hypothetical protein
MRARGQATRTAAAGGRAPKLGLRMRVWSGGLGLDCRLAEGASPANSPELALRAEQLVADRSRRALSRALIAAVDAVRRPRGPWGAAAPIAAPGVRAAEARLVLLARDLVTTGYPSVRAVALVSWLVCDPTSPLHNGQSPVTVSEIADRAQSALSP